MTNASRKAERLRRCNKQPFWTMHGRWSNAYHNDANECVLWAPFSFPNSSHHSAQRRCDPEFPIHTTVMWYDKEYIKNLHELQIHIYALPKKWHEKLGAWEWNETHAMLGYFKGWKNACVTSKMYNGMENEESALRDWHNLEHTGQLRLERLEEHMIWGAEFLLQFA